MGEARVAKPRLGRLLAAALALAGLAALPQVRATAAQLGLAAHVLWTQPAVLGAPLGVERAGEEALGPMRAAVELLREHGVESYRASAGIAADALWSQRLVEGAWPIRPRADARFEVSLLAEPSRCPPIAERRLAGFDGLGVRLARCP